MKFIKSIINLEKKYFKYFYKSSFDMREMITGKILDDTIKKNKILKKNANNLIFYFFYNSKIAREFLLNPKPNPKYVWEPQTTKLILQLTKKSKNIISAGSFFGDQAILAASRNPNANIHAFEPSVNQIKCLKLNIRKNKLNNIIINRNILYSKSGLKFKMGFPNTTKINTDEGNLRIRRVKKIKKLNIISKSLDDYCLKKKIRKIDLLFMDVEGSELKILLGAKNKIRNNQIPNIIFELNSNYFKWNKGLKNVSIIKYLLKKKYNIYAIRDIHSSFDINNIEIELLPLTKVYIKGPNHGFNMLATKNTKITAKFMNNKFSPKYLPYKSSKYFHTENLKKLFNN
jgi:FkbM family methyltransferase